MSVQTRDSGNGDAKDACDSLSAHEDRMFANMLPILLLQHGPTSYWEREAR